VSVFVVGSLHLDVIVDAPRMPGRDETLPGTAVAYAFGGKGGNQAVAAARHGAPVAMAGRVGSDDFAARLLAELDMAGVDRTQVHQGDGASGMSVAIVDANGDYGAVVVSAANLAIDAAAIDLAPGSRAVVLQNEIPESVNLAVARKARVASASVVLNAAPARDMAPELLALVDVLVVNRVEAAMMTGRNVATPDDARQAAETLSGDRRSALVTMGGDGVVVRAPETETITLPAHRVDVVSTHGAGDAFVGALAARLADRDPLADAVAYAQAAAALHVSVPVVERRLISRDTVTAFAGIAR